MPRVLLVEDERSILKALSFELEDAGYEVLHASSYQEAASYISALECDLIVSDLFFSVEQGDGIQLLNEARRGERQIPFIAMTAFPETNIAVQAKKVLRDRFFVKPFYARDLRKKIGEILQKPRN